MCRWIFNLVKRDGGSGGALQEQRGTSRALSRQWREGVSSERKRQRGHFFRSGGGRCRTERGGDASEVSPGGKGRARD